MNLKRIFKSTLLALAISTAAGVYAAPQDEVVAVVDNSIILRSDLNDLTQQLASKNPSAPIEVVKQQALEQLIARQAQLTQVKRYNVKPDEKTLNEAVLKFAQQSGASSLESFQQQLDANSPGSYELLRSRIAEDLALNRLRQQMVMSRIHITDQDVKNFLATPQGSALLGKKMHLQHLRITGKGNLVSVANQVRADLTKNVDLATITQKYSKGDIKVEAADMGLKPISEIPTEIASRVTSLNVGDTTPAIAIKDSIHLAKLIDQQDNTQKVIVPQYKTRHILIQTSEIVSPENAKQMIDSLYARLKRGEDFAVLAGTFSNDTGSARDSGNLGWVNLGVMVPEFEEKMKETPVGQISEPFQTQFGWHILQVTEKRDQDMTADYQQRMARQFLGERQFDAELDSWMREIRNNAFVEIKDPTLVRKTSK